MFVCHDCDQRFVAARDAGDPQWICPKCRARVFPIATLDRRLEPAFARTLHERLDRGAAVAGDPCPSCRRTMREVAVTASAVDVTIDGCRSCNVVRLAAGVFEQLPRKARYEIPSPTPLAPAPVRPQAARGDALSRERRRWRDDLDDVSWLARILMWLGMPVDVDAPALERRPWTTWSIGAALVVVFLVELAAGDDVVRTFAWIPSEPFRLGGLTLLTSFFLHAGWLHLLGNLYFLLAFGRGVEGRVGGKRMVLLLAIATALGNVTHALFDPSSERPAIGASGGLSALILFYAAAFPWNRFAIVFWFWFVPREFIVPAVLWAALWFVWQIGVAFVQHFGGNVSGFAHLGGALTGLAAWLVWRRKQG